MSNHPYDKVDSACGVPVLNYGPQNAQIMCYRVLTHVQCDLPEKLDDIG